MQGYIANVADLPLFKLNDMNNRAYIFPPWLSFMWCLIDIVLYLGLFIVCNAYAPRFFGMAQIKLSEIFRRKKKSIYLRHQNSSNTMKSAIEVDNLIKVYRGARQVAALNSVNFDIKRGEVIVMIGPNGAGKSTMINCISGGIKPTDGCITILG